MWVRDTQIFGNFRRDHIYHIIITTCSDPKVIGIAVNSYVYVTQSRINNVSRALARGWWWHTLSQNKPIFIFPYRITIIHLISGSFNLDYLKRHINPERIIFLNAAIRSSTIFLKLIQNVLIAVIQLENEKCCFTGGVMEATAGIGWEFNTSTRYF